MMDHLRSTDPDVHRAIVSEARRQAEGLELIASENFVSQAVLEAMGQVMTNKYAEGLPGKRYYGGCEFVDVAEDLARDRAARLIDAEFRRLAAQDPSAVIINRDNMEFHERSHLVGIIETAGLPMFPEIPYREMEP